MSSSSGDLRPEMMESETPPFGAPSDRAGEPEVSAWRISPDPPRPEGNPLATRSPQCSAPKESNRGTVIERISSAKSGLHEAFMSLLKGFEIREIVYVFDSTAHVRCALCR